MFFLAVFFPSLPVLLALIINLLMLGLFIAGLVVLIRWLVRRSARGGGVAPTALDIAKERYARGEINKAEFEEIKKNIS